MTGTSSIVVNDISTPKPFHPSYTIDWIKAGYGAAEVVLPGLSR